MLLIQKKLNNLLNSKQYYNNYFNRCVNKYKKVENYITVYDSLMKFNNFIKTDIVVNHTSNIHFGMRLNKVIKYINVPYRIIKNNDICEIIFYKEKIGDYKTVIELHFFEKKLCFFKYTFPSSCKKTEIKNIIKNKYFNKNILFNYKMDLITDNNNYMRIEDEVSFSVYYFSLNFGLYDFLIKQKAQIKHKKTIRKELQLRRFLDKI
jgi:hypothetical protein